MNAKTLTALKGSIVKWEKIVARKREDKGGRNCPLCVLFSGCNGCPIVDEVGHKDCKQTPHQKWCEHQLRAHQDRLTVRVFVNCPKCARLAQAELDFLRSLLPKGER